MIINRVSDIRQAFRRSYINQDFRGNGTIELRGVSFLADQDSIFGTPNQEYIRAEIAWYESGDRRVQKLFDLYGKEVKIWKDVADEHGEVNSNYGWCINSLHRFFQYQEVYHALRSDKFTRQGVMIYTTPAMHKVAGKDFTCTNAVQYLTNGPYLDVVVQMRSNDAVFGYANDLAWQQHVQKKLCREIGLQRGDITWQVGSMHVYERHYHLIEA